MRVRFHEAAMAELAWEVQYYAKISPQLGERFATVVERISLYTSPLRMKLA